MSCHQNIIAFIERLPTGTWFATRQLLEFGSREAVDQTLYRLVKIGFLRRIAWGLFTLRVEPQNDFEFPSIAHFKARVFRKTIAEHGLEIARKLGLINYKSDDPTFCVHGVSSSFLTLKKKICLRNYSARKIALGDSAVGQAIRALWFLGKDRCDSTAVQRAMTILSDSEVAELTSSSHLMPGWLTKIVRDTNGWQPVVIL